MRFRKLGELEVSELALGCMGMSHAYGAPKDEKEMIKLIHKANELGVNFFDTAQFYGPYINEELVAKALSPIKDKVVIATKGGIINKSFEDKAIHTDASEKNLRAELEGSLKRLKTDCIDLFYLHRIDPKRPLEEIADTLGKFVKEGKVKYLGLSDVNSKQLRTIHSITKITAIQNRYSMMVRRDDEEILPTCQELGISYVAFSPLANGFLSGAYDENSKFEANDMRSILPQFKAENIIHHQNLLKLLKTIADENGASLSQIALAWILAQYEFTIPLFGTTNLNRLCENVNASNILLSKSELATINAQLNKIDIKGIFLGSEVK